MNLGNDNDNSIIEFIHTPGIVLYSFMLRVSQESQVNHHDDRALRILEF